VIRLGVCGWPVAHSRSPQMHRAALRAAGLADWHYLRLPLPPELFAETVAALPAAGFRGVNVTIPHKQAALALADEASDAARQIGAANMLTFENGRIHADNTDAPGFLDALPEGVSLRGARALVLGAGGSARAVVWALVGAGAAEVRVWNRTPARARALASELGAVAVEAATGADLLVNCTSVGLGDPGCKEAPGFKELPVSPDSLGEFACVVDLVYRPGGTELLREARERGTSVVDGLEILVHQGALSYEAWTGRAPDLAAMSQAAQAGPDAPSPRPRSHR
jgi:shikimate dehydrogenase